MATQCNPILKFGATRDFNLGGVGSAVPLNLSANDRTGPVLKSTTTPPVTQVCTLTVTLTAGAATLDLTNISYEGDTIDLTGLKVQVLKLKNSAANTFTISEGASNGYAINGGTAIVVPAGAEVMFVWNENQPDVAAADATLDFAGTTTQSITVEIAAG